MIYRLSWLEKLHLKLQARMDAGNPQRPPARMEAARRAAQLADLKELRCRPVVWFMFSEKGRKIPRVAGFEAAMLAMEQQIDVCRKAAGEITARQTEALAALQRQKEQALEGRDAPHMARLYEEKAEVCRAAQETQRARLGHQAAALETARLMLLKQQRSRLAARHHRLLLAESWYLAQVVCFGGTAAALPPAESELREAVEAAIAAAETPVKTGAVRTGQTVLWQRFGS